MGVRRRFLRKMSDRVLNNSRPEGFLIKIDVSTTISSFSLNSKFYFFTESFSGIWKMQHMKNFREITDAFSISHKHKTGCCCTDFNPSDPPPQTALLSKMLLESRPSVGRSPRASRSCELWKTLESTTAATPGTSGRRWMYGGGLLVFLRQDIWDALVRRHFLLQSIFMC